jgi:SAM-dependent methyltransferase
MRRSHITNQVRRMREDWDRRAMENARYYVATGQREWSEEEFYQSGETAVDQHIRSDLGNVCQGMDPRDMQVLEIGCGAGRITRALAGYFGRVYAVDISGEMVRLARQALGGRSNARVLQNNGKDLSVVRERWWHRFGFGPPPQVDFAFSYIVFQHIPSREIIENYVREVNRLLRPGGLFKFQVQGSSQVEPEYGDSWVGASFTGEEAADMARRCGFEMRYASGADSQEFWLWFFKTSHS